jgi:hypothetical protein
MAAEEAFQIPISRIKGRPGIYISEKTPPPQGGTLANVIWGKI